VRKKLLERLRAIFEYYHSTRGVGHTTAMLKGARFSKETLVIVHDEKLAGLLKRDYDCKYITLSNLVNLRGQRCPMVIDHYALTILLAGAIECLEQPQGEFPLGSVVFYQEASGNWHRCTVTAIILTSRGAEYRVRSTENGLIREFPETLLRTGQNAFDCKENE
jgi:hypothetical protein